MVPVFAWLLAAAVPETSNLYIWYLRNDSGFGAQGAPTELQICSAAPAFAGACCGLLGFHVFDGFGQLDADRRAAAALPWARACELGSGSFGRPMRAPKELVSP